MIVDPMVNFMDEFDGKSMVNDGYYVFLNGTSMVYNG